MSEAKANTTDWGMYGIDHLPDAPFPIDLADLPLVRAAKSLPPAGHDGVLPLYAYHTEYQQSMLDGSRITIEVTGHPKLGAPYGEFDHKMLVAIFSLLDRNGWYDGVYESPSHGMFIDAMGLPDSGRTHESLRDSLTRLANVRLTVKAITRSDQLTLALANPDDNLVLPAIEEITDTGKDTTWLIDYAENVRQRRVRPQNPDDPRWKTDSAGRTYQTEHTIERLRVNPILVRQALRGWAAWIDTTRFATLRSPYAMRLYILLAGRAAQEKTMPSEWRYPLGHLRRVCGVHDGMRPAVVAGSIEKAAQQLVELDVLKSVERYSTRGNHTLVFSPGAELRLTNWLLGVRPTDLEDTRVLLTVLARYGFQPDDARALLSRFPEQTRHIAQVAVFTEQVKPESITSSMYGFIKSNVQRGSDWSRNPVFQRWVRNGGSLKEVEREVQQTIRLVPAATDLGPPESEEAAALWESIRERIRAKDEAAGTQTDRFQGALTVGWNIDGDALICRTTAATAAEWLPQRVPEMGDWLSDLTDGRLGRVRIEQAETTDA